MGRVDFAQQSKKVTDAVWRSWVQATGLSFTGWGACSGSSNGVVALTLSDQTQTETGHAVPRVSADAGYTPDDPVKLTLRVALFDDGSIMSGFGNALGFVMDGCRAAPGSAGACGDSNVTLDLLDTPTEPYFSVMDGWQATAYWDVIGAQHVYGHPNYFADLTGDGRADAILIKRAGVVVREAGASSFGSETAWTSSFAAGQKGTFFTDVTGEGRADLVAVDDDGIHVRPSNGTGFSAPRQNWTSAAWYGAEGTWFADVNGDGKADAIGIDDDRVAVRLSNGQAFPAPSLTWGTFHIGTYGTFFADLTGDHKADAVLVEEDGIHVMLSTGSAFGTDTKWTSAAWYGARVTAFADVDADGKADAIGVDHGGVFVRRSTGSTFSANETWISTPWNGERGTFFADVTNDKKADILGVDEGGVYVRSSNGSSYPSSSERNYTAGPYYADRP